MEAEASCRHQLQPPVADGRSGANDGRCGLASIPHSPVWEPLNKSILDLPEGAESGTGPDSATP